MDPLRLPEPIQAEAADRTLAEQLHALVVELAVETERLLGTGPPWWKAWLLTRSGQRKHYMAQ